MMKDTKKLTMIGMLCAIAYAVMVVGRIPVVLFLKYDPKDVIIAIGGFLFGPLSALAISAVVSFVEMFTVSDTGPIGMVMNILSSGCFACTAALIYKKQRTMKGAVLGLVTGCLLTTGVMLLWNYLITPIYMGYPREAVAALLLPAFLPFNLLKYSLNAALTLLFYKPVVTALRRAGLIQGSGGSTQERHTHTGLTLAAVLVILTCILVILMMQGVI